MLAQRSHPARALTIAVAVCGLGLVVSGCSMLSASDVSPKAVEAAPPEQLYGEADRLLSQQEYTAAAKKFEDVDREHPYSPQARRALAMAAFSHFKAASYEEAISAARRYTTLHPGTKEAALALHITAMSYYNRLSAPGNDQSNAKLALTNFSKLRRQHPESKYAKEAVNRMRIVRDTLAANEMQVGRYYQRTKNYTGAINRFRTVVTTYQKTQHVEEALYRLTESYLLLGVASEAQTAAAVLGHNFPTSPWYKRAYTLLGNDGLTPAENRGSWISNAWSGAVRSVSSLNPF
ncbi:MAG: outer membrane protein assembly factor BamD [Pseudomonadota bacterium]